MGAVLSTAILSLHEYFDSGINFTCIDLKRQKYINL
jgi:hypothetical protein